MTTKNKKKPNKRSLANLKPGGNLQHGAFRFLRTGEIPCEAKDIAAEAKQFEKLLNQQYRQPGNITLNIVQAVTIRQLVSNFIFSELLITHLWRQVARAGSKELGAVLVLSGWGDWLAASNRMGRLFRQLGRNLRDFR